MQRIVHTGESPAKPYAPEGMEAYAVSQAVHSPRHNAPDYLAPV